MSPTCRQMACRLDTPGRHDFQPCRRHGRRHVGDTTHRVGRSKKYAATRHTTFPAKSAVGESKQEFPIQQPTSVDFLVWKTAIGSLCRGSHKLIQSLGNCISTPQNPANGSSTTPKRIYIIKLHQACNYAMKGICHLTRFGARYLLSPPRTAIRFLALRKKTFSQ